MGSSTLPTTSFKLLYENSPKTPQDWALTYTATHVSSGHT